MSDANVQLLIAISEKLDRVLKILENSTYRSSIKRRGAKEKQPPLTKEEIAKFSDHFEKLFSRWEQGHEVEVERELEAMDVDDLRRFADANNLNVTTKMPKPKVMQLLGARFRERRQLLRSHFHRDRDQGESS